MDNPIKNDLEKKSSLSQMTEEDYKIMKDIIELINKSPNSESFKYPVDIKVNPNYLRVINFNPMDLSTIEKKLSNQEYSLVQDAINDIKLIWYNCRIYNRENSDIYAFSNDLEKLADKELEKYYIYYDKVNKSVNYKEQYEKNVYDEEAFTDPDYLEKNKSDMSENEKNFYIYLYYKIKLKQLLSKLKNEQRKNLFTKIKEDTNQLSFLNKYIESNKENSSYFKFHIENMIKEDILFLINYISNNFDIQEDENFHQ